MPNPGARSCWAKLLASAPADDSLSRAQMLAPKRVGWTSLGVGIRTSCARQSASIGFRRGVRAAEERDLLCSHPGPVLFLFT
eukprot:scaffold7016_cov123-Isochrysis_galbana.AAC.7